MLKERLGFKRAAVVLARKLAMIMHAMLQTGELFNPHQAISQFLHELIDVCGRAYFSLLCDERASARHVIYGAHWRRSDR